MKNYIFWSEIGSGSEELGGTPPPRILRRVITLPRSDELLFKNCMEETDRPRFLKLFLIISRIASGSLPLIESTASEFGSLGSLGNLVTTQLTPQNLNVEPILLR